MDKLLSTKEASQYLGIAEQTLANYRWSGVGVSIPYIKLSSRVLYKQSELDKYIEAHTYNNTGETRGGEA